MPAPQNVGHLAQTTELPLAKAQFAFGASLTNAADQTVPPGFGTTSLTSVAGWLVSAPNTSIGGYRVQYTGDAANVAGQTISVRLQYKRGVAAFADITGSTVTTPIATAAGQKNGGVDMATYFEAEPGDVIRCLITPSAALSAVVTDGMIALY